MSGERHDSPAARELPTVTGIRVLARRTVLLQIDGAADVTITPGDRMYSLPMLTPEVLTLYAGASPAQQFQLPNHLVPVLEHSLRWGATDIRLHLDAKYSFLLGGALIGGAPELMFLHPDGTTSTERLTPDGFPLAWSHEGFYAFFQWGRKVECSIPETQVTYTTREVTRFVLSAPDVLKDVLALWGIGLRLPEEVRPFSLAA
ncbi:hypothetical protein [Deinococcus ruber]|uniref:Uncharacterized protein n=1 Tax=Deinococcus ruber TaxID=1848197 RepID=A0A918CM91_9DEIO|nr:hypothetical protein [Deinococcus ruber]GGR31509.1 hypothetical protein GCM10008957_47790 [Deinococcus ruber]